MTERIHLPSQTAHTSPPARERVVRALMVVALSAGAAYLTWRLVATLNPEAMTLSVVLWSAEAWTFLTAALLFFAAWDPFHRAPPPPAPPGWTVDVFVPTLNEPVWVVRRALIGALAIDYPHRTWLLDDADRPEMRALADGLGVGYLPRPGNEGAKAGHLNYALERTDGEFVAFFDADHVAMPEFLDRTLGYFTDERVAIVQTPQEFYNTDSYEHDVDKPNRRSWHEQTLFYRLIQPGKDRWNSAFFCGSCGIIRRTALEDVGGFPTDSITEDIYLSLLVHARGWRSVYQREVLAYGLAPQTAVAHQTQRLRWGQGAMQVLRKSNPLTLPGLTLAQRLNYLASMLPWFDGWQKLIFYLTPPLFLITGILPLRAEAGQFALAFVGAYGLLLLASRMAGRGAAKLLLADAYHAAAFYVYIKATFGLFARRRLKFAVTDKQGQARVPLKTVLPAFVLLVLSAAALAVGVHRFTSLQEPRVLAFWVNVGWVSVNMGLLAWGVWHMLRTVERRAVHRIVGQLPVDWGLAGGRGLGLLEDFNEQGGRLRVHGDLPERGPVLIRFWPGEYQQAVGEVRWWKRAGGSTVAGLRWIYMDPTGSPADLAAEAMLFAQRRFLHAVDFATSDRDAPDVAPIRTLPDGRRGLLERFARARVRLLVSEAREVGSRVRFTTWDDTEVQAGTVEAVRHVALPPYSTYELELSGLTARGRRPPVSDVRMMGGPISDQMRGLAPLNSRRLRIGITTQDGGLEALRRAKAQLGCPVDIVQVRVEGASALPQLAAQWPSQAPCDLVLAWSPPASDDLARRWLAHLARLKRRIALRPLLDGPDREAAFRRLRQLGVEAGAETIRWVWTVSDPTEQQRVAGSITQQVDVLAIPTAFGAQPHETLRRLHRQLAGEPRQPVWLLTSPSDYPGHELAEWLHSVLALGALPGLDVVLFDGPLRADEPTYVRVSRTLARTARAGA
jgi:cellulose synthase (UDP-forming)